MNRVSPPLKHCSRIKGVKKYKVTETVGGKLNILSPVEKHRKGGGKRLENNLKKTQKVREKKEAFKEYGKAHAQTLFQRPKIE